MSSAAYEERVRVEFLIDVGDAQNELQEAHARYAEEVTKARKRRNQLIKEGLGRGIVTLEDVANELGISRQRVHQLSKDT